jgi:hypothetical protein
MTTFGDAIRYPLIHLSLNPPYAAGTQLHAAREQSGLLKAG